jgi:hypothetical protein
VPIPKNGEASSLPSNSQSTSQSSGSGNDSADDSEEQDGQQGEAAGAPARDKSAMNNLLVSMYARTTTTTTTTATKWVCFGSENDRLWVGGSRIGLQ